jgi:hypothetical protein
MGLRPTGLQLNKCVIANFSTIEISRANMSQVWQEMVTKNPFFENKKNKNLYLSWGTKYKWPKYLIPDIDYGRNRIQIIFSWMLQYWSIPIFPHPLGNFLEWN